MGRMNECMEGILYNVICISFCLKEEIKINKSHKFKTSNACSVVQRCPLCGGYFIQ